MTHAETIKRRWTLVFLVALGLCFSVPSADAVLKVKKKTTEVRPVFQNAEEEKNYDLRRGEILTEGDYLKKGVWGKMVGAVQAPPQVVWRLFLQANEWGKYGIPNMVDSRAVDEYVANRSRDFKKVEEVYAILGNRVFDPMVGQKTGGTWVNYTFQYYDLPWPVANKWVVVKNINDETHAAEGGYRSDWSMVGGNMNTMNGTMTITPFQGEKDLTLLEYRIESDPASHVPKFLLKWGVKKTMPVAMKIIRRESKRLYGRPVPLLKIQHQ